MEREAKKPAERGAKSDAVVGFILSLIGLPLCLFFVPSIIGIVPSSTARKALNEPKGFRVIAAIGLQVGILGLILGVVLWSGTWHGGRSRELARRAACLSNLKAIAAAIHACASDYRGFFPARLGPEEIDETCYRDLGMLYPRYVTSLEVFVCPSSGDRIPKRTDNAYDNKPFPADEAKHISYAYGLDRNANNKAWTQAARGTTRILADRHASRALTRRSNHKTEGRNVAFADGHAEWILGAAPLDCDPENPDPNAHGTGPEWWSER